MNTVSRIPFVMMDANRVIQKGDKGDQGVQGVKGDQGDQGVPGAQGVKGDQGNQGIKGDKGDKGEKGDKGDTGDQGPKGDQGDVGPQGDQGAQGIPGLSAYPEWLAAGNTGTVEEFLENEVKGDKGDVGPPHSDQPPVGLLGASYLIATQTSIQYVHPPGAINNTPRTIRYNIILNPADITSNEYFRIKLEGFAYNASRAMEMIWTAYHYTVNGTMIRQDYHDLPGSPFAMGISISPVHGPVFWFEAPNRWTLFTVRGLRMRTNIGADGEGSIMFTEAGVEL